MSESAHPISVARRFALALLATAALWALSAPGAQAEFSFCPPGEAAAQCGNPQGLATDFETGRVFVAEQGNHRVSAFDEDGAFLFAFGWGVDTGAANFEICTTASTCQKGIAGAGPGQLDSPPWIAVDNVPGSPNRHDVYVSDRNNRISHFKADGTFVGLITSTGECQIEGNARLVSIGPAGNVFVNATEGSEPNFTDKILKFSPTGECLDAITLVKGHHRQWAMAVDLAEDVYVADEGGNGLRKYELSADETESCKIGVGVEPGILPGVQTNDLTVDENGHLFAYQRESRSKVTKPVFDIVTEYDQTCNHVRRFGYDKIKGVVRRVAPLHTAEGDVFASERDVFASENQSPIKYILAGGPGPIAIEESLEVLDLGNTSAEAYAEINPEGKATDVVFEFVSDADFQEDVGEGGNGFEGDGVKSSDPESLVIPPGKEFRANAIEFTLGCAEPTEEAIANGECLIPSTTYHWRALATNADGAGETVVGPSFKTKEPLEATLFATGVDTTTATVNALVNPLGIPTTGFFEYVDQQSFEADVAEGGDGYAEATRAPAVADLDFGSGSEEVRRSIVLFPLTPHTVYRYRLVAENDLIEVPLIFEAAFTTFAEQGKEPCPQNEAFRTGPSELLPDCRAYEMVSPLDKENGDIAVLATPPAVVSQSAGSGEKLTYGSTRAFGDAQSAPFTSQYLAQRDPAEGWRTHGISPPQTHLIKGAIDLDFEFRAFSDDLCQGWITPMAEPPLAPGAEPGNRNLYRRDDRLCGPEKYTAFSPGKPERLNHRFILEPNGVSADGTVAALAANDTFEGSGAPGQPSGCSETNTTACNLRLYVHGEGQEGPPRFACVLPGGAPHTGSCLGGSFAPGSIFGRARSSLLTGAFSDDGSRLYWTAAEGEGKIYLRENPLGEGPECSGPGTPCSYPVSADGEAEAGTTASLFMAGAADGSLAYYLTVLTGGIQTGKAHLFAYDFGAKESTKVAGEVIGVLGASEDASRIYFVSGEVLDSEENQFGAKAAAGKPNLYLHEAGAGSRFIGTLDAKDVKPFPLIAGTTTATSISPMRHNARVSPGGMHVAFMSTAQLTDYENLEAKEEVPVNEVYLYDADADELLCASCNPSGARPEGENIGSSVNPSWIAARITGYQSSLYAARNLADSGERLYFESIDPLVPRDTNGRLDVYQWEREGTGGCDGQSAGFSPAAKGCIDLISSGQSKRHALFLDASNSGNDVFFTTLSSLLPEDYGLVDAYDARVGGGFPSPPPPALECEGETCRSPAAAPEFQTPASAGFKGPSDPRPAARKRSSRCAKGSRRVRRGGKSRCVKKAKQRKRAASKRRAKR